MAITSAPDLHWRSEKRKIVNFIEKTLPGELENDQLNCKILTETDLHTCVFSHLNKFFQNKFENWFILNEPYLRVGKEKKNKPDIVICRKKAKKMHPIVLIELKEKRGLADSFSLKSKKTALDSDTQKLIKILKQNKKKKNRQRTAITHNYLILALTSSNPDRIRRNDPSEIEKMLQKKVGNELQKNGLNKKRIQVIVISAFYSKDFEARLQALEKIRTLREIRLK